jgi:hypothetical protein
MVALLTCIPFMFGFPNMCTSRMHAAHPITKPCNGCDSATEAAVLADTKAKLQQPHDLGGTGPTMTVALGAVSNWDAIELCAPGTDLPSWVSVGPRLIAKPGTETCPDVGQCKCWYDLTALGDQLDAYVKPRATGGEEMNLLLQLAPIFFTERKVPAYLKTVDFNDAAMLMNFRLLWDHVSRLLASPDYAGAQFVIGLGNEVNVYLNNPTGAGGLDPIPLPVPAYQAWEKFFTFFQGALAYVRTTQAGYLNTCFWEDPPPQGCPPSPTGLVPLVKVVGLTTAWLGGCGLGNSGDAACNNVDVTGQGPVDFTNFIRYFNAMADVSLFTYYPVHQRFDWVAAYFNWTDEQAVAGLVAYDMDQMMAAVPVERWVFLQEAGMSSNRNEQGFQGVATGADELVRQKLFVNQLFSHWYQTPAPRLYLRGASAFALHDFSTVAVSEFPGVPCNTTDECTVTGLNLECYGDHCRGGPCSTDTQCDMPLTYCCTNATAARCGAGNVGHCTAPSVCDKFTGIPLAYCADGADEACQTEHAGSICATDHECVFPGDRAFACGWGLHYESGTAKPAWTDAFVPNSILFDQSANCSCADTYPCTGDCPGGLLPQHCEQWYDAPWGVCLPGPW